MTELELSAGPIEYEDVGGGEATIVFVHGLLQDSSLWRAVLPGLSDRFRCIAPTWPLGSHRKPMRADAELHLQAQVRLLAEFLERLELSNVCLVGVDWGAPPLLVSESVADRVGAMVLCSMEAFDNFPPGLPGAFAALAAKLPGGINAALQPLRLRFIRRLPIAYGWMSKRPVPDAILDGWLRPALHSRAIRRDLAKYARTVPPRRQLLEWAQRLRAFSGPVLVVWAGEDRIMPREHGPRLADLFPRGRLVEVPDSYTLIPEDQPERLTALIREFIEDEVLAAT